MPQSDSVREYLVDVETDDGLVLPGALITPASDALDTLVVWLHGFGSSYDYRPCLAVGRSLAAAGSAFLSITARGNHGAVTGWQRRGERWGTKKVGSWYEIFAESAIDIEAWLRYARALGYRRLVLVGHSFGAAKVAYYLGTGGGSIDGLVLASPSRGIAELDPQTVALARQLTERGDGGILLPEGSWPRGFGTKTVSAQTFASWADAREIVFVDPSRWQSLVTAPVLAFYGDGQDVGAAPELDLFTKDMSSAPAVERVILPGVTHNYDAGTQTIATAIQNWWRGQRENQTHKEAIGGSK
jgi:pimeloyl-ACP methyl ester carboxylesterase